MTSRVLRRVLLVEDDPDIQAVADAALSWIGGLEVEVCASAKDALDRAPAFRPDLILLDVMMPGMDGPQALLALREIPETRTTPVVFMTARVQPHEVARYKALGSLDVIAKPFEPEELAARLRQMWARLETRAPG
jgi:two-component system, OmpR family, response regulator